MTAWFLVAAVVLLGANAFFVAAEFALVAARVPRLEASGDHDRASRLALASMRDLQRQLAGAQLGITMASLGLGYVAEPALTRLLEPVIEMVVDVPSGVVHTVSLLVALAIVVTLHMVLGEMVPKNIAITGPEPTVRLLAPVLQAYVMALRPVIWALNTMSAGLVRMLGLQPVDEIHTVLTVRELHTLLAGARATGVIEKTEHDLLAGALELRDRSVGSLMVPTDGLVSAHRSASVAEIEEIVAASGHTRVPIWASDPDDVIGFVHAKDLLRMPADSREEQVPLELIRRMLVVRPDYVGRDLMMRMRRSRDHIAVVRDGGGQMLGIVTFEDLLELLVGDIYDETDQDATARRRGQENPRARPQPPGRPGS